MKYIIPLFASLMCLVIVGCSSDDIVVEPQNESIGFLSVGDPVQVSLNILPGDFLSNASTTRAIGDEDPINYTPDDYDTALMKEEAQINNFWVLEYNENGNLIYKPQYVEIKEETVEPITVELSDNAGYPVTIYVVANANGSKDASSWITLMNASSESYGDFDTIEGLLKQNVPFCKDGGSILIGLNADGDAYDTSDFALPMSGSVTQSIYASEITTITVPLNFMVAKVMLGATCEDFDDYDLSTDFETLTADLYYINAPSNVCTVGALGTSETSTAIDYSALGASWIAGNMQIDLIKTPDDDSTPATYQYVLYTAENFQGFSADGGATGDSNKYLNAPQSSYTGGTTKTWNTSADGSSWDEELGIKSFMSTTDAFCTQAAFTVEETGNKYNKLKGSVASPVVFSGGNSVDNFNVRRSCVYHVMYTLYYDSGLFKLMVRLYYIEPEEWFENGETFTTNTK